jgi:manganese/iron transport system ATP-binding protein
MHDMKLASERFDRVMLLNKRVLGIGLPHEVFVPDKLMLAYGDHLRMLTTKEGVLMIEDTCCEEGDHPHA